MVDVPPNHLFLGEWVDAASHERTGERVLVDARDLTTHGVIVGMTGSGKTGLGVVLVEEALLQGIPVIVLDPKGDMGNLALTFPDLAARDFRPWINEADAARRAVSPEDHAATVAEQWRSGLERWGIGPERLRALREQADVTIHTPGSGAGVPVNLIGHLDPPTGEVAEETRRDEIEGIVTSLLGLVGIDADPLSSREHILLSNLIHHAWSDGHPLDLATLVGQVQDPPLRKLGVLDLETFFPAADRTDLMMQLNGLLASPSFAAWTEGPPLDIGAWLDTSAGPRASIVTLSHLSDEERQFVVTLVLSKLVTWCRAQPGTPELRALVYMDEVFGFVPPTAAPPSKKPILTILKQARAVGVGMVLATQNPVDVDYKALSNAGTWTVGRLQTERDRARLLDGMSSAAGSVDLSALDDTIGGLAPREFVLHQTGRGEPAVFTSRWAMSYLAGPLTRDQIARLTPAGEPAPATAVSAVATPATTPEAELAGYELADDETTVAPIVPEGIRVGFLDPAAPWADRVGARADGHRLAPALAARVHLVFDERSPAVRHEEEWEAVLTPLGAEIDPTAAIAVDYDDRDVRDTPPPGAVYLLTDAGLDTAAFYDRARRRLVDHLTRSRRLTLLRNEELGLVSRVDETREQFVDRCGAAADAAADADAAKVRAALEKKIDRVRDAIAAAEDRLRQARTDAEGRTQTELISRAGDLLGSLLGGRRSTRSITGSIRRASTDRRQSANAAERAATAERRLEGKLDELADLQTELEDTLFDIQADWDAKAGDICELTVPLESADVTVDELRLVWIPTARGAAVPR